MSPITRNYRADMLLVTTIGLLSFFLFLWACLELIVSTLGELYLSTVCFTTFSISKLKH